MYLRTSIIQKTEGVYVFHPSLPLLTVFPGHQKKHFCCKCILENFYRVVYYYEKKVVWIYLINGIEYIIQPLFYHHGSMFASSIGA
jgi:hypothetical protein